MTAASDQARARQIELILEKVDSLPTLSPIATRLLSVSADAKGDLREVIRLIESDPGLSVRILGLCRRADRGLGDRVKTVQHAVVMLGFEAVRSAALAVSVYEVMSDRSSALDRSVSGSMSDASAAEMGVFDRAGFWKHSLAVACASELIARAHPKFGCKPEEVFSAGLLHALGKLSLELVLPQSYARVLSLADRRRVDSASVERPVLGLDHHTAGKRIAEKWGLPAHLQDVIWLHGRPYRSLPELPHRPAIGVVTAAKALCRELHLGWSGDFGPTPSVARACAETGLDEGKVRECIARLHAEVSDRCKAIGLDDRTDQQLLLESIAGANSELNRLNAALVERSRAGEKAQQVLGAVAALYGASRGAPASLEGAALSVAASMRAMCGSGRMLLIAQGPGDEPWHAVATGDTGAITGAEVGDDASRVAAWCRGGARLGELMSKPWAARAAAGTGDARSLVPMILAADDGEGGFGAVVLHDRSLEAGSWLPAMRAALTGAWASAVMSALRHESSRRLTEKLAESSRAVLEMQARMTEAESMVRLGEMTAGAAHEMNNPLTVISGRAQLLARAPIGEKERAAAAAMVDAAADLKDLIGSLHLLSKEPEVSVVPSDLRAALASGVREATVRREAASGASVIVDPEAAWALADGATLSAALAELIVNAVESKVGASVRISAECAGDTVRITVRDDGPGLSARAARHAFDPFFSDKPAGRQRGLGLARARRQIEAIGGRLTLENAPGGGAVATVSLARAAAADARRVA